VRYEKTQYVTTRDILWIPNQMFPLFQKRLVLKNCLSGETKILSGFPVVFGDSNSDFFIGDSLPEVCSFNKNDTGLIFRLTADLECLIDGSQVSEEHIPPEKDHSLLICKQLFLLKYTNNPKQWLADLEDEDWHIVKADGASHSGPASIISLVPLARRILEANPAAILRHTGSNTGFYLHSLEFLFGPVESSAEIVTVPSKSSPTLQDIPEVNSDTGHFTCPACWLRFDRGDAMHISVHEGLKGDPVLGEDAMLRFLATNFNNRGQAVDAMGIPTSEMACPHCRGKLPPGFLDLKQHIVSIVGAPQSGKSYFLSVLTHVVKRTLYHSFDTSFHDGDPTGNRLLTAVTNNLFSASTPEQARIAKTGLEGDMYLNVTRMGRRVKMPRPFTFQLSPSLRPDQSLSVVFYDNAGEHFEPGIDGNMSPGAQHISAASGIVFLFDPTYNLAFRKRLHGGSDPQLTSAGFDQQDTILAEMNVRVKNLRGIDFREKIDTPLAVVVGKCDVWSSLLGDHRLDNPVEKGVLNPEKLRHNSEATRKLLLELVPPVVANAEIISSDVMYFPASSFGCSPEIVRDAEGNPKFENGRPVLGPDPSKISPILVDVPLLWLLSRVEPGIVPTKLT
jgi:hypothetical protein